MKPGKCLSAVVLLVVLTALACSNPTGGGGGTQEQQTVASVEFSLPGGSYSSDQQVTLTSATSGATIYYTTDGSSPTSSSSAYSAPIAVAGNGTTMTIKAFAAKSGMTDSAVTSATYSINYNQVASVEFSRRRWVFRGPAGNPHVCHIRSDYLLHHWRQLSNDILVHLHHGHSRGRKWYDDDHQGICGKAWDDRFRGHFGNVHDHLRPDIDSPVLPNTAHTVPTRR